MDKSPTVAASAHPQGLPPSKKSRPLFVRILLGAGFVLMLLLWSYIGIKPRWAALAIVSLIASIGFFAQGRVGAGILVLLVSLAIVILNNWGKWGAELKRHRF